MTAMAQVGNSQITGSKQGVAIGTKRQEKKERGATTNQIDGLSGHKATNMHSSL